jgi:membrane protein insertase Oxa1/YidC/SpoIIIJ
MAATIDMAKSVSEITTKPSEEELEQQKQQDRLDALLKEHGVSPK